MSSFFSGAITGGVQLAHVKKLRGAVAADVAPAIASAANERPAGTSSCATSLLPRRSDARVATFMRRRSRPGHRQVHASTEMRTARLVAHRALSHVVPMTHRSSPRIDAERRYRPVVVVGIHYLRCCYTASALLLESGRRASSCSLSTPASFFGSHRRVCPALPSGGWYAVAVHGAARDIFRAPIFIRVVGSDEAEPRKHPRVLTQQLHISEQLQKWRGDVVERQRR